jgi:hypothetical protein
MSGWFDEACSLLPISDPLRTFRETVAYVLYEQRPMLEKRMALRFGRMVQSLCCSFQLIVFLAPLTLRRRDNLPVPDVLHTVRANFHSISPQGYSLENGASQPPRFVTSSCKGSFFFNIFKGCFWPKPLYHSTAGTGPGRVKTQIEQRTSNVRPS